MLPGSWISRLLRLTNGKDNDKMKDSAKSDGDGRGKPNSFASDPYAGITEISQVAAIHDFYEVRTLSVRSEETAFPTWCGDGILGYGPCGTRSDANSFESSWHVCKTSHMVHVVRKGSLNILILECNSQRNQYVGGVKDNIGNSRNCVWVDLTYPDSMLDKVTALDFTTLREGHLYDYHIPTKLSPAAVTGKSLLHMRDHAASLSYITFDLVGT